MNTINKYIYNTKSLLLLVFFLMSFYIANAQCGSCTNPATVTYGIGTICYDQNTTITNIQMWNSDEITICDNVILTVSSGVQIVGNAKIKMNNCSELIIGAGLAAAGTTNSIIYTGDNSCDARVTVHTASALGTSLTTSSHIHYCDANGAGHSGSTGAATIGCGLALPAEIVNFETSLTNDNNIDITWQTASQINNDFFTIERSIDGKDWEDLSYVKGERYANKIINYRYTDENPYTDRSYYRLKQTDLDGQFSYSDTRSIELKSTKVNTFKIYPNPVTDNLYIEGKLSELNEVSIYNILGQNVKSNINIHHTSEMKIHIDLSGLDNGTYLIKYNDTIEKFVKY